MYFYEKQYHIYMVLLRKIVTCFIIIRSVIDAAIYA